MTMLMLSGYIHVTAGDVAEFVGDMAAFAPVARARDGCLFFSVAAEDLGAGRMLVVERWRDQAALDAHLSAAETIAFVARWRDRMKSDLVQFDVLKQQPSPPPKTQHEQNPRQPGFPAT